MDEHDPDNPKGWTTRKKLLVACGPLTTGFIGSLSISMYMASIPGVEEHFRVSTTLAISPLSFAALGFFLGPILAVSVSEIYGRIWVYRVTIPVSLAFTMIAGSAQAFRTLIVGRTLASVAISPSVSVAAGVINDLWDVKTERMGTAIMLLFASSIVWATEIGPPSSVAIVNDTGDWRWSFYLTAILLGVCLLTLLAPETYGPEIIRKRDARQGNTTTLPSRGSPYSVLLISTGRALHMISTEPIVRYTTMMAAVYQGVIYCFYVAFPLVFQTAYDFTEYQIGMSFLSLFIGSILGLLVLIMCDKWRYQPAVVQARQTGGTVLPEERLYPAMLAGLMMPVSLFWLAWTARSSIHWVVPLLSCIPLGMSILCILLSFPIYRNDVYGAQLGASVLAADNIMRYGASIGVPLFTRQMVDRIGFDWTCSILGFISLVLAPIPWIIYRYGGVLRAKSRYMTSSEEADE